MERWGRIITHWEAKGMQIMSMENVISLPYPPSVNRIWRKSRNGIYLSKETRLWREECQWALKTQKPLGKDRVTLFVWVHPPDKRRRDIDNLLKSVCDILHKSGIIDDDEQIDEITIRRMEIIRHGRVDLLLRPV